MGPLARGISNVMGLSSEAYANHKNKKSRSPSPANGKTVADGYVQQLGQSSLAPPSYDSVRRQPMDSDYSYDEDDDDVWVREEAQKQLLPPEDPGSSQDESVEAIISRFEAAHSSPEYTEAMVGIQMPAIIPQKRPERKGRGWVRAYAPVLNDVGIDQATFMDFLDGFQKVIKVRV